MILARRRLSVRDRSDRMDEPVGIKNENDRSVAQNRIAREHCDMPQPTYHRLDYDFLGIEHRIHDDAEALSADLHHDDEAVIGSPTFARSEFENSFQIDQRQQLVAQPQHGGILDVLDGWLAMTAHAYELDDDKLRDGKAFARGSNDQSRDDRQRERYLNRKRRSCAA